MASLPLAVAEDLLFRPGDARARPARLPDRLPVPPAWLFDEDDRPDAPADQKTPSGKLRFRTVWISDIHLGTAGCNADMLLDFLKSVQPETLYLVGDIIDGWKLKRGWYWPARHNDVVRRVLKMAAKGCRVVYIPGNHDEMLRPYAGLGFGGVEIALEAIHTTADGRRLLVCHGDEFDGVVLYHRWLAWAGDIGYSLLLRLNVHYNAVRRRLGLPYWSISAHIKKKVKNAVAFIGRFEAAVAEAARLRGVDGVVCGHIHSAEIRDFDGIQYFNDGDWVESCTALVEHADGRMEIRDWTLVAGTADRAAPAVPAALANGVS